ncbi:MAG: hypothetical protein WCF20_14700 [Methylovirgula sp.]
MPINVKHRLPEPDILAEIGAIAILHTQMENQLRMLIMALAAVTKNEALDATARSPSSDLRELVKKLGKQRLGECPDLVKLRALIGRCERATTKRNAWMHSVWGTEVEKGGVFLRVDDHSFKRAPSKKQLNNFVKELIQLIIDLVDARLKGFLRDALDAKPLSLKGASG